MVSAGAEVTGHDAMTDLNALRRGEPMTPRRNPRTRTALAALGTALALLFAQAGCGAGAPATASTRPSAAAATGPSGAPGTAAPARRAPHAAALNGDTTCTAATVHQKHLSKFSCDTCHPTGGGYGFTNPYVFPRGTTTNSGTLVLSTATAPTTCTVACHYPLGGTAKSITWTTPGPLLCTDCHGATNLPATHPAISPTATATDCLGCHQTTTHLTGTVTLVGHAATWMTQTDPGFHAFSADADISQCQQCHAQDLTGGVTGFACGKCHDTGLPAGVTSWKVNCVMCHGGTNDQTGAPPAAIWGQAGDPNRGGGTLDAIRVGAHAVHLAGSGIAPAFGCDQCHVKPTDALQPGHVKGPTATVTFAGLATLRQTATATPTWTRTTATCSNVYCHGNGFSGGTNTAPVWTAGSSQATCGTCHGLPPPTNHPTLGSTALTVCNGCHPATIDATGTLIAPSAGGKHLDGVVEAQGGHEPSWIDPTSAGFHAFTANQGLAACKGCHGANLDGVGGMTTVACAQCHKAGGTAHDFATCTACHGGTNDATGAPPAATWGYAGDPSRGGGTLDPIRVGAHTAHVTGGAIAQAFDCGVCHVKPASWLDLTHVDGALATVTFSGLPATGGVVPTWSRATATCATTYCHGNYTGTFSYTQYDALGNPVPVTVSYTGGNGVPVWTGAPMTCGSCHGNPPQGTGNWHASTHGGGSQCELCHPDAATTATGNVITDLSRHLDGVVEVTPQWTPHCFTCH